MSRPPSSGIPDSRIQDQIGPAGSVNTIRFCPRCRRPSPSEASFCYFDGQDLQLVLPGLADPTDMGKEFVFPSGRRCRTFDDFVEGCMADWATARELLGQGALHQFFSAAGRADIAQSAWRAVQQSVDLDEALDWFLSRLPTKQPVRAELDFTPRRLQFGRVIAGDRRTLVLRIRNTGRGLLRGRLRLEGVTWLEIEGLELVAETSSPPQGSVCSPAQAAVGADDVPIAELVDAGTSVGPDGAAAPSRSSSQQDQVFADLLQPLQQQQKTYVVRVWREQEFRVTVNTEHLAAGQMYHAPLILETNGGTVEIPVDVEVGAIPFSYEPFRGVSEPKYLAARMRLRPREAARLLRDGVVRQWFEQNRWVWPVNGDTAPGIAAVQQFYEALGVVKPPRLEVEPARIECTVRSQEPLQWVIEYRSPDPKWVYAKITVEVPWLQAEPNIVYGAQKTSFRLTAVPAELPGPGRHKAEVLIEGNGGQRLSLPLCIEVPEPEFETVIYLFLGSLVFGLLGAGLRFLTAWPDFAHLDNARTSSVVASLLSREPSAPYRWMMTITVALLVALWAAWKLWRRNRAWEDAFSGLVGGGLLGVIAGLVFAGLVAQVEPVLASGLAWAQSSQLAQFPGIAVATWYLIGSLFGMVVALLGRPGQRLIRWLSREYAVVAKRLRLKKIAAFFALRWD